MSVLKKLVLKRWKAGLIVLAAGPAIFFSLWFGLRLSQDYGEYSLKKEGDRLRDKIEIYRHSNGELPKSLEAMGISDTEEGPLYYQREGKSDYILWFGTSLGESVTYSSKTRQWDD